ncbi:uncharacterized protein LOC141827944 [Curcuma longa]|uniref:uncharacterized protein LOC141827944 n=1 Tax=Curcuma longa TaxID=136217 RepID=UPI003D9F7AE2
MRPREREEDEGAPTSREPSPAPPLRRPGGGLSSMVVRPPERNGGGEDAEEPRHASASAGLRHDSPDEQRQGSPLDESRRGFSPSLRGRDSPPSFRRRASHLDVRRRGGGSPGLNSRYQWFRDGPGSLSPPHGRFEAQHSPDFDSPMRQHFGRGFRGGRAGGRFREVSPVYGHGRGQRSVGGGNNASRWPVSEGEYVHRNDPNLSPREGDWICQNPSCGNLNFARRTHCNNCNKYRYGPEFHGPNRSPRRGYLKSPPIRKSPPRILGPTDRATRDDLDRYRSPPRSWDVEDSRNFRPRDFKPRLLAPARGGKFADIMRRERPDYYDGIEYRQRRKFDWPTHGSEMRDNNRDELDPDRRSYDRRPMSPPRRWFSRERSRSPVGDRPMRNSYVSRGRDDSYLGRGWAEDLNVARGRGYRQTSDSFTGRGAHIDRRGITRGRSDHNY